MMQNNILPEKQLNLSLSDLRDIFQQIDNYANTDIPEREILAKIAAEYGDYEFRFLRWLVRHTMHPESDDDIMSDEVAESIEAVAQDGSTINQITFKRIPPTVKESYLVQYKHTFWHIRKLDQEKKFAELKLLSDYANT
ncbi:MAG: hypothetical protein ACYTFY_04215 [Planctomycetota bacterium]|jgi:hypothetical protein